MIKLQELLNVVSYCDIIAVYYNDNIIACGFSDRIKNECKQYLDCEVKGLSIDSIQVYALNVKL